MRRRRSLAVTHCSMARRRWTLGLEGKMLRLKVSRVNDFAAVPCRGAMLGAIRRVMPCSPRRYGRPWTARPGPAKVDSRLSTIRPTRMPAGLSHSTDGPRGATDNKAEQATTPATAVTAQNAASQRGQGTSFTHCAGRIAGTRRPRTRHRALDTLVPHLQFASSTYTMFVHGDAHGFGRAIGL